MIRFAWTHWRRARRRLNALHPHAPKAVVLGGLGCVLSAVALGSCARGGTMRQSPPAVSAGATAQASPAEARAFYARSAFDNEPIVRVRIERDAARAVVEGQEWITQLRVEAPGEADPLLLSPPLRITLGERSWRLDPAGGAAEPILVPRVPPRASSDGIENRDTLSIRPLGGGLLELDGVALPGFLVLHATGESASDGDEGQRDAPLGFDIVEHLPIELYLPGVIAKELYGGWQLETYRAQAIAARSYALHEMQRRRELGLHYDVESTTEDQVYGGASFRERALEAVRSTRGVVLTFAGELVRAYYSSTTGGRAASAADTWPTGPGFEFNLLAPIQASPRDDSDRFSPLYRWTVERDAGELATRIAAWGRRAGHPVRALDRIEAILPAKTNRFGRPTRYTVRDASGGRFELSAEQLRVACNTTAGTGLGPITRDQRINSGDFSVAVRGGSATFVGRGFGHGVGMSQFGAEGMARAGRPAEEILGHYYPGTELRRAY